MKDWARAGKIPMVLGPRVYHCGVLVFFCTYILYDFSACASSLIDSHWWRGISSLSLPSVLFHMLTFQRAMHVGMCVEYVFGCEFCACVLVAWVHVEAGSWNWVSSILSIFLVSLRQGGYNELRANRLARLAKQWTPGWTFSPVPLLLCIVSLFWCDC